MDISVILPNFNGAHLLQANLPKVIDALREYKNGKREIIVADDASSDNSAGIAERILKNLPKEIQWQILINMTGKNKGFGTNVNNAVSHAKGDIVVLLNTDVSPKKDFLDPLLKHFNNENTFAVGCMDESIEDGKTVLRGRGIGVWKRGFLVHRAGSLDKTDTLWVSGGSSAFRKSIWDTLGGFLDLYSPFYWEDIDISYRAQKAGYNILFEKESVVRHEHEKGAIKKSYSRKTITTTAYRNQFFFTWVNATDTMILIQHMLWLPVFLIRAAVRGDGAFLLGFFNAVMRMLEVLRVRKRVQKMIKVSDKKITQKYKENI